MTLKIKAMAVPTLRFALSAKDTPVAAPFEPSVSTFPADVRRQAS
jgi:hypothetical protein